MKEDSFGCIGSRVYGMLKYPGGSDALSKDCCFEWWFCRVLISCPWFYRVVLYS